MNKEYIERSVAIAALKDLPFQADIEDLAIYIAMEEVPAADVAPVRHGYWKPKYGGMTRFGVEFILAYNCSECNFEIKTTDEHTNYCPNCGAKMDGKTPYEEIKQGLEEAIEYERGNK